MIDINNVKLETKEDLHRFLLKVYTGYKLNTSKLEECEEMLKEAKAEQDVLRSKSENRKNKIKRLKD